VKKDNILQHLTVIRTQKSKMTLKLRMTAVERRT
jgi:hypothetical protein